MSIEHDTDSNGPTLAERRRQIVHRYLQALMQENSQYYYEPAAEVARAIHATFRKPGRLDRQESEAVMPLTIRDIETLLAYK